MAAILPRAPCLSHFDRKVLKGVGSVHKREGVAKSFNTWLVSIFDGLVALAVGGAPPPPPPPPRHQKHRSQCARDSQGRHTDRHGHFHRQYVYVLGNETKPFVIRNIACGTRTLSFPWAGLAVGEGPMGAQRLPQRPTRRGTHVPAMAMT